MKIVLPDKRIYKYKQIALYLGKKKMNPNIAENNLIEFLGIMDDNSLSFVLLYGTLLGAIRNNAFIEHDEDIDIGLEISLMNKFLSLLFILKEHGFYVARHDARGFISLIRNSEYIDVYFFSAKQSNISQCCGNYILTEMLTNTIPYSFYRHTFLIPEKYELFFLIEYGSNWRTPIEFKQNKIHQLFAIFKQYAKDRLPPHVRNYYLAKKEAKLFAKFTGKLEECDI